MNKNSVNYRGDNAMALSACNGVKRELQMCNLHFSHSPSNYTVEVG